MNFFEIGLQAFLNPFCWLIIITSLILFWQQKRKNKNYPPSPFKFPISGHLHLLAKHKNPWESFESIKNKFGDIVSLQFGIWNFVLVSSFDLIKEVLVTKANFFLDRPSFQRYSLIFGGDRDNALALCDWSQLQNLRRNIITPVTMPKTWTNAYKKLNEHIVLETNHFLTHLDSLSANFQINQVLKKNELLMMCLNIFINYFCSQRFEYKDKILQEQTYNFDFVFFDINQCYLFDMIPWLSFFSKKYLKNLKEKCISLRTFVDKYFLEPRLKNLTKMLNNKKLPEQNHFSNDEASGENYEVENDDKDFTDTLLKCYFKNPEKLKFVHVSYIIGDLLGGSSAIGNLLFRAIGYLTLYPEFQEAIYQESMKVLTEEGCQTIDLSHRKKMMYTQATILETLRIASSPLVPHICTESTKLKGYDIDKKSIMLFNVHQFNMDKNLWESPLKFDPTRFLFKDNNNSNNKNLRIVKFKHFFPFSMGKRTCLGQKLNSYISFIFLANLIVKYKIKPFQNNQEEIKKHVAYNGSLAMSVDNNFKISLIKR